MAFVQNTHTELTKQTIPNLLKQLEVLRAMPLLQRFGIPGDELPPTIDVINEINMHVRSYYSKLGEKGRFVSNELRGSVLVKVHQSALKHILTNIIINIMKYADANSTIDIGFEDGNEYRIQFSNITTLSDSRMAVSPEDLRTPGRRGDNRLIKQIEGDGMGLEVIGLLCRVCLNSEFDYSIDNLTNKKNEGEEKRGLRQRHKVTLDFSKVK